MSGKLKTILLTGASSGIGAYCARALRDDGWRVFATARRKEDIAALEADGITCFYLDYCEPDSIETCFNSVLEKTGGTLDALFNNGAYAQAGAVEDLPVQALRDQFDANFFGWHDLTRRVVPIMRRQGHGRIIHCSSVVGYLPVRFRGAYCASKHALEGLMLCLNLELHGTGVHVSMIEPGPVTSKIASNGLAWFERYIDAENSPHHDEYQAQIARLKGGGVKSPLKLGPQSVYRVLKHALNSKRPKPHYLVTVPAWIGAIMKRVLPKRTLYRALSTRG